MRRGGLAVGGYLFFYQLQGGGGWQLQGSGGEAGLGVGGYGFFFKDCWRGYVLEGAWILSMAVEAFCDIFLF